MQRYASNETKHQQMINTINEIRNETQETLTTKQEHETIARNTNQETSNNKQET